MNDVAELKQYIEVHARAQDISPARYRAVLDRIKTDVAAGGRGSWAGEWTAAAQELERSGRPLEACRHYNLARFPYVDGPARQEAHAAGVRTFDEWRRRQKVIERRDVEGPGGVIRCWTSGLSGRDRKPLLIIMGGIVTVKEQWAAALAKLRGLGMACLVTELPGVGENTLSYNADSWRMLPAVLDAVSTEADVTRTYVIALSFSGQLALRCAASDQRIKGVVIAGAPVSEFFTDAAWQAQLPRVTVETLAHLTGSPAANDQAGAATATHDPAAAICDPATATPDPAVATRRLFDELRDWALSADELGALEIPVRCLASKRDEIIPPGELRLLREHVRNFGVVEYDDVHGSPQHVAEARLWAALCVLEMRGVRNPQRALLSSIWRAVSWRSALSARRDRSPSIQPGRDASFGIGDATTP